MTTRDLYNAWSATYDLDRNLTRDLDEVVTRNILADVHGAAILEIGCGTSKNTSWLAHLGGRVGALDFSAGMIAQAKAKVRADHVTFAVADLTQAWPCADQSMDLIVCNLVLEHIADLSHVFAQARRALAERGRFFICELHPFRQYQGKKATFQNAQTQVEIPAFVHHISDFLNAAERSGFTLKSLQEWWHAEDRDNPPRLVSFMFEKSQSTAKV